MISYQQAPNKRDSQFYMEPLLKPKNSLHTTRFELGPSDCEQEGTGSNLVVRKLFSGFINSKFQ